MARTAVVVGTASAVAGGVQHRQQQRYAAQDQQQAVAEAPAAAQEQSPDDQYAELEKLGQLKQEGILTQEEFDAKKKQILGL